MSQNQVKYVPVGMVAPATPEQTYSAGGYRLLAVIAFIAAVGGLFIGLLSKWAGFLAHSELFSAQGGVLDGSLIGFFIHYAKTVFTDVGILAYLRDSVYHPLNVANAALLLSSSTTALAIVLSLVLGVVSFVSRKAAKGCAMTSAVFVFLGYAGLFATNFYTARLTADGFARTMFDIPTAIIGGVMLICLLIAALARRKGLGLLNFVLFLLTALTIYALCNTQSLFAQLDQDHMGGTAALRENLFFGISTLAFLALLAFNFVVSVVRLNAKKAYVFDAIRFVPLLVAAVLAFIANGLSNNWALFNTQMLSVILMLAAPLAAILFSLVIAIGEVMNTRLQEAKETSRKLSQPVSPARDYAAPTMDGQQPGMPVYPMPYYTAQQPTAQPDPAATFAKKEPMSEFERNMAALAKGGAPAAANTAATAYQPTPAPVYAQPISAYTPKSGPMAAPAPKSAPAPQYDAMQYTYDPFINSLTPQEKNEFGDLFIANNYGDLEYLPAYVIGGDNSKFFSKVFIYIGRFRSHISSSLLEKLYVYVTRSKK